MGNTVSTINDFRPTSLEVFALYIEGERCPFNSINITMDENEVPIMQVSLPAGGEYTTLDGVYVTLRDLPPVTKVLALYKDTNWGTVPRFCSWGLFEVLAPGFEKSFAEVNFQFTARHIMGNLEGLLLSALSPEAYLEEIVTGQQETSGQGKEVVFAGTVFELMQPELIASIVGKSKSSLNLQDFAKGAFFKFMQVALTGTARKAGPIQACEDYGLFSHIYRNTNKDTVLNWGELYGQIMQYSYMQLMPRTDGVRIAFIDMLKQLGQLFMHHVDLMGAPKSYQKSIVIKPENVFMPPPVCNVIFPSLLSGFSYSEPWYSKPTRMVQVNHSSVGLDVPALYRYTRTISPPSLRDAFNKYRDSKDAQKDSKFDLTTPEEKYRGLIESYNEIPAFVNAAFDAIKQNKDGTYTSEGRKTRQTEGTGFDGASSNTETSSSINYVSGMVIDKAKLKTIFAKTLLHKTLLALEQGIEDLSSISSTDFLAGGRAITANTKMQPKLIKLVFSPKAFPLTKWVTSCTYSVSGSTISLNRGRYFHIFEEPTDSFPSLIKFDKTKKEISDLRGETPSSLPFLPIGSDQLLGDTSVIPLQDYKLKPETRILGNSPEAKSAHIGGTQEAITIQIDSNDASSRATAGRLIGALCEFCELSPEANIITLGETLKDYWVVDKSSQELSWKLEIQAVARKQITKLNEKLEAEFNKYLNKLGKGAKAVDLQKTLKQQGVLVTPDSVVTPVALVETNASKPKVDTTNTDTPPPAVAAPPETKVDPTTEAAYRDLQKIYLEPLSDYYFYKKRYEANSQSLNLPFTPYITAGYSGLVLDDSPHKLHLKVHVSNVALYITPSSGNTSVGLTYVRPANTARWEELVSTAAVNLTDIVDWNGAGPLDVMDQTVDLFSGEWSTIEDTAGKAPIDDTFQNLLGCSRWKADMVADLPDLGSDYRHVMDKTKRVLQTCQVKFTGSASNPTLQQQTQQTLDTMYKEAPSYITFSWDGGDFPDHIDVSIPQFKASTFEASGSEKNLKVQKIGWNPKIQAIIKDVRDRTKISRVERGQ